MIDPNAMTIAEIHDDLLRVLNNDEVVDPIGYLETLQLRLQTAIAVLDSAELARGTVLSAPSEPVPDGPRVWAMPELPEDVSAVRDREGLTWERDAEPGMWVWVSDDGGEYEHRSESEHGLVLARGPLTEVVEP